MCCRLKPWLSFDIIHLHARDAAGRRDLFRDIYFLCKKHPELNPISKCFRLIIFWHNPFTYMPGMPPGRDLLSSYAYDHWYGDLLLLLEAVVAVEGAQVCH